jgi:hypothetical protein
MTKPLSPLHRPLDIIDASDIGEPYVPPSPPPIPSRIARLAQLDSHSLSGRQHSLGPGGASAMFTQAVQRALVEEMAAQLRLSPVETEGYDSEIGKWAQAIIAAFCEE